MYMKKWLNEKGYQFQQLGVEAQPHQTLDQLVIPTNGVFSPQTPSSEADPPLLLPFSDKCKLSSKRTPRKPLLFGAA